MQSLQDQSPSVFMCFYTHISNNMVIYTVITLKTKGQNRSIVDTFDCHQRVYFHTTPFLDQTYRIVNKKKHTKEQETTAELCS